MLAKLFDKYRNMSKVAKAAMWFAFATIMQKGISFFTVPVFTRIMTTEQYGLFNVYLSWTTVLNIIVTMELHSCAYLNGLAKMDTDEEKNELATSLLNLSFILTLGWFTIYLIFREWLNNFLGMSTVMVVFMFLEIFFLPAVNFWTIKQRYTYNYKILVIRTLGQAILNAVLGIVFVLLVTEEMQANARVAAIVVVQMIFGISMYIWFTRRSKKFFSVKYWKRGLMLHLPLIPHRLSLSVLSSADRIMIQNMVSSTATALYSVAYSATMVINIIKLSINDALTPWVYECLKKKDYKSIYKNTVFVMLIVMAMAFLFVLFAPEIIFVVGSEKYYEAIYVIPPVAASVFFTFLYNLFSSVEFYYEKTKEIMVASLTAAVSNIVLNFIFINLFGYVAAGYTTLACYIILSVFHYLIMKKAVKNEVSVKQLFNLKAIVALSAVVIVSMAGCTLLYFNNIIRYIVIGVFLVVLLIMHKKIINLIKMLKKKK